MARPALKYSADMRRNKTIIFLGDGMSDEPVPRLGGRTPLQTAYKPAMDSIARDGRSGTLRTLPLGFPTSSEVANMSVLGCDLRAEYCGRGPLEAAGHGVPLSAGDKAFRLNLTTVAGGRLADYSGGHLPQDEADEIVAELNRHFGGDRVRFYPGVSYRSLLVLSGPEHSHLVRADKPDDNQGERLTDHLPKAISEGAESTARFLSRLMLEATAVLETCPANRRLAAAGRPMANGVWPWSGGMTGAMRKLKDKYGITGAVISAVDVIVGLGLALGMDAIRVPGATGYVDTNFEGKAQAAIDALRTHDLVYLHVEAIDEVSHERNLDLKVKTIEAFDARAIGPVLSAVGPEVNAVILPDHPVPVALGKHTRTPVPVAVRMSDAEADGVTTYDEVACLQGSLGAMSDGDLMAMLFGLPLAT